MGKKSGLKPRKRIAPLLHLKRGGSLAVFGFSSGWQLPKPSFFLSSEGCWVASALSLLFIGIFGL
jgi:hypothetical protein